MNALLFALTLLLSSEPDRQTVVVVVGAPGRAEYGAQFQTWADRWADAARIADAKLLRVGPMEGRGSWVQSPGPEVRRQTSDGGEPSTPDVPQSTSNASEAAGFQPSTLYPQRAAGPRPSTLDPGPFDDGSRRRELLAVEPGASAEPLWLVLIGHGTFDGQESKFNVRGPDFSAKELAEWLAPFERPVVVVDCTSASGPFLNSLSAEGRAIVTATRSGAEQNFAYFGNYFSQAIGDPASDLDKDEQVSLLEAFLAASAGVAEFYEQDARLATEHALLDDNGDGLGTPATWFRGVRATQAAREGAETDGRRASQLHLVRSDRENRMSPDLRARRDQLELHIARLHDRKSELSEDAYYEQLRPLMLELARIYEQADQFVEQGRIPEETERLRTGK